MEEFYKALQRVSLRKMPWRDIQLNGVIDPYHVLVSEIMLQQTQVKRVTPKFQNFIKYFPDIQSLAKADLGTVLEQWSGLGYNRRAKFLHEAAKAIALDLKGQFPQTTKELMHLPGVGKNTAGAILVYSYNQPAFFVETNVRTVYIHHFFKHKHVVTDQEIVGMLEKTLDHQNPRDFYWRLMDYGTALKKKSGNLTQKSAGYTKQSRFAGSNRQIRGQVLKALTGQKMTHQQLAGVVQDDRLGTVLERLQTEGLVSKQKQYYSLG